MPDRSTVLFGISRDRADRWLAGATALGFFGAIVAANSITAASYLVLLGAAATATETADNGGLLPGLALTVAPSLAVLAGFLPLESVRQVLLTATGLLIVGLSLGATARLATVALFADGDRLPRPVARTEVVGLLGCTALGAGLLFVFGLRAVPFLR